MSINQDGWYQYDNGYSVIVPMEIFNLIHTEEFKNQHSYLTEKIMTTGLESLNEEEKTILASFM